MSTLSVRDLVVEFDLPDYTIRPLDGLSFDAQDGELIAILGPSGCGKTTLLSCLAGLLTPKSGTITFGDIDVTKLSGEKMAHYRRHSVGVVFQAFNLIPSLSALRNVMAPLQLSGVSGRRARKVAVDLLTQVGLADRLENRPAMLSGGQQQRVAIARALVQSPPLVIADEPTAHLDYVQVEGILRLIRGLAVPGRVVLIATHDERITQIADRVINLVAGAVPPPPEPVSATLDAREILFEQGDPSDLVYVVESGAIEIFRRDVRGQEVSLRIVEPGSYFGELGPLLKMPRSATARATEATVLIGYPPELFTERSKKNASQPVPARRPSPIPLSERTEDRRAAAAAAQLAPTEKASPGKVSSEQVVSVED
jgi:putative ABC transport system ATP-binding protein